MPRAKVSGNAGVTRSVRLPGALDRWFEARMAARPEASPSEMLVALVHGGLRLREGYMAIHRRVLEHYIVTGQGEVYAAYCRCLLDTFGPPYVEHLERWLVADGFSPFVAGATEDGSGDSVAAPARSENGEVVAARTETAR